MSYYDEVIKDAPLAYWRMSDTPFVETQYRFNLCPNPSVEVDSTGFSTQRYSSSLNHSSWAGSRQTDGGWTGSAYYRATATAGWSFNSWLTTPETEVTAGKSYVVSMYVRVNRARTVGLNVESVRSGGSVAGLVVGTPVALAANTWTRLSQVHTVPSGGVRLRGVPIVPSLNNGDRLEVDGILYEEGPELKTYFDGSTASCVWLGTAGKSSSRMDIVFNRRYMEDENGVYRGDYSASGINFNVAGYPEGGDGASQFLADGTATVVGGSGGWDLGTNTNGQWTVEFFARFDNDSGGNILETDKWKIATVGTNRIGYMAIGTAGEWSVPVNWQDNAFHYYVFTFNNGLLTMYVDGEDILAFADTNLDASGSGALRFATSSTAVTLDEVAVYPRALNDGRITAHWMSTDDALGEVVTAVYIEPRILTLQLIKNANVSQQMTVTVQYSGGGTASPLNAVWSTSDATVASVNASGLVRALKAGSAGITVTLPDLGATAFVGVAVLPPDPLPSDAERALYTKDSEKFAYDPDTGKLLYTTEEYWEVDPGRLVLGEWVYDSPVSLATLAYNISTLAGREGIPVSDGENLRVPTRPGRRWIPKTPDQRTLSLAMWVQGTTTEGDIPKDIYLRTQFWEHYNKLKALFAVWDRQILLKRRMVSRYGIQTMQTWVEPSSSMDLNPTGPMRATFTIDLIMTDPFWRGVEQKSDPVQVKNVGGLRRYPRTYELEYGSIGATGIYTLINDGTHDARLVAEVHGAVQNPYFFNMDTNERLRLVNDVDLNDDDIIEVDFYNRTIQLKGSGSRYWWLDRTTDWFPARPGSQRLMFGHDGLEDKGYVVWRWEPSYL
jgi:hypothetical protein